MNRFLSPVLMMWLFLCVGRVTAQNHIIVTVSNTPPNYVNQPISITGSARYSFMPMAASGNSVTLTLGGETSNLYTYADGTYEAELFLMAAGVYTARVYITDHSISGTGTVQVVVQEPPPPGVTQPDTPTGPASVRTGEEGIYQTGGSESSFDDEVEYRFDFGDGTTSGWSTATSASHAWGVAGTYGVAAQARSPIVPALQSTWSEDRPVAVEDPPGPVARYVSPAGGNQAPYTNWAMAAHVIQDAMDVAGAGETVWVSNGVYASGGALAAGNAVSNRVLIRESVRVESVNGPEVTVIAGEIGDSYSGNSYRGVYLEDGASLIGFTVTNGFAFDVMDPYGTHQCSCQQDFLHQIYDAI